MRLWNKTLAGFLLVGTLCLPFQTVFAAEKNEQPSMIDQLKQNIKKTESYQNVDTSMLGQTLSTVTVVQEEIEVKKQEEIEEEKKLSSLGIVTENAEIASEEIQICSNPGTSHVKTYMDGAKVTNTASAQYQLLQTMHINEQGFYATDDGYIGVALGSYYGPIGTKYLVTLENGTTLKVIKADAKADIHVYNGCYHRQDGSMMEFIVDTQTAGNYWGFRNGYVLGGNFNNAPEFQGAIVKMERVL